MKKCSGCSKSKLFIRLQNGLCPTCTERYLKCEKEYRNILIKSSLPNQDIDTLKKSIVDLQQELKEFDTSSNSLKSYDCDILSNIINIKYNEAHKVDSKKEFIMNTKNEKIISSDNQINNEDIEDNHINKEEINTSNINDNLSLDLNEKDHVDIINNNDTGDNLDIDIDSTVHKNEEPIQNISEEVYKEAEKVIDCLSEESLEVDKMCYYTFLLRDTFLPQLKKYKIEEINDVDIEELINRNINKASAYLSCKKEDLFSLYNYVSFSIQTTGLNIQRNDILEISALKIKFGKVVDTFYTLVNPNKTIGLAVERSTGITNDMIKKAPYLDVALKGFISFCEDYKLISHNINYSYGFIKYYYNNILNKQISYKTEGIIRLYRMRYSHFHGEPPENFDIQSCCNDILSSDDIDQLSKIQSKSMYESMASYELYEILKSKYK